MPRRSLRKKVLCTLQKIVSSRRDEADDRLIFDDDDSLEDGIDDEYEEMLNQLHSQRYLNERTSRKRESMCFNIEDCLSPESLRFNEEEFLAYFRLTREQFKEVAHIISSQSTFVKQRKKKKARSHEFQLLVFLYRVGQEGSGGSDKRVCCFFGIAKGSVRNYVRSVTKALRSLYKDVVTWPTEEDKRRMRNKSVSHGFRHCIGIIDGTLLYLSQAPTVYPECYFSRKDAYAINILVVCDDLARITYIYGGWPGSTHDNRSWRNCKLFKHRSRFFGRYEYLLGDSAFSASAIMVQSFKKSSGQASLNADKEKFTTMLGSLRVKSEHCIGLLKNRFPFMKSCNISVEGRAEVKEIMDMFEACAVLHNLLIDDADVIPNLWYEDLEACTDWSTGHVPGDDVGRVNDDFDRRESVFNSIRELYF
jgi:hypothetical protein